MVSTLKARPNHYDALGLSPAASDDEVSRAFTRQMGLFRPMAESAQIGIAFETLRNPVKRRAYDAALGLRPNPPRRIAPTAVAFKISARFNDLPPRPVHQPLADDIPRAPPMPSEQAARANEPAENRAGSFIAAALRPSVAPEPPQTAPAVAPQAEAPARPQADVVPILRPMSGDLPAADRARLGIMDDAEDRPIALNRSSATIGGLVLAVALIGAWAGTRVGNAEAPQPATPAASIALPPATELPEQIASSSAPAPSATGVRPERYASLRVAAPRTERKVAASPPRTGQPKSVASRSVGLGISDGALAESTIEQPVAEASRVTPAAAALPLPNAVIARTIERIGYTCGKIGSTAAVAGGAPGVFNVTCTSGHSYQATPVRGRYRFRRVNGH
ncbi:MAG: hypothetical protein ABIS38_02470 [Sphingomicrobium sp.]